MKKKRIQSAESERQPKTAKRFSIRTKLILIFGILIAFSAFVQAFFAVRTARKAVTEKVEIHLKDKANDTAVIIDERITSFYRFLEGIARIPILYTPSYSYAERIARLKKEAALNNRIIELNITTKDGLFYTSSGNTVQVSDRTWFRTAVSGTNFISEPYIERVTIEVQSGSEEMLRGGEEVAKEIHKLDNLTRVITAGMNEMAAGAVEINNAVQEVNKITQKNKTSIENLAAEVGKFKV